MCTLKHLSHVEKSAGPKTFPYLGLQKGGQCHVCVLNCSPSTATHTRSPSLTHTPTVHINYVNQFLQLSVCVWSSGPAAAL